MNHNDRLRHDIRCDCLRCSPWDRYRSGGLHDSEQVVGRIPVYSYRHEIPPVIVWQPEPTDATWGDVVGALAGLIVLGILFLGLFVLWPVTQ